MTIDDFKIYLARAVRALAEREENINRLNRFPVADFDTGTNLLATARLLLALCPGEGPVPFSRFQERVARSGEFLGLSGQMIANFIGGFFDAAGGKDCLGPEEVRSAVMAGVERASRSYIEPAPGRAIDLLLWAAADRSRLTDAGSLSGAWEELAQGAVADDAGALGIRVIAGALAEGPSTEEEKKQIENSLEGLLDGVEPAALDPVIHHLPGRSFQVVTDSSADLSPEEMEKLGISMIPLRIVHRGRVYGDGVNLDSDRLYRILEEDPQSPTTSLAPKEVYLKAYRSILKRGDPILSIHLSSDLSGNFENALQAVSQLSEASVEVVDSQSISLGLGYMALEAARMADRGLPLSEAAGRLRSMAVRSRLFFTVRTLRYLRLGGRVGRGAYILARTLGIRPVLGLDGGRIVSRGKALGRGGVRRRILARVARDLRGRSPSMMAVATAADPSLGESLAREVKERFSPEMLLTGPVGALIGVHSGPGAWGIFYITGEDED
jgi:DegV family protein with EDD domain